MATYWGFLLFERLAFKKKESFTSSSTSLDRRKGCGSLIGGRLNEPWHQHRNGHDLCILSVHGRDSTGTIVPSYCHLQGCLYGRDRRGERSALLSSSKQIHARTYHKPMGTVLVLFHGSLSLGERTLHSSQCNQKTLPNPYQL